MENTSANAQNTNALQVFNFKEQQVEVIIIDGEPHFIGKQVATILGYSDPQKAVRMHVDNEDRGVAKLSTPGGRQDVNTINESGMYSLILSSKLDNSKRFKRWITNEILPSIRKYGVYAKEDTIEQMLNDPDSMITILQKLKEERAKAKEFKRWVTSEVLPSIRKTGKYEAPKEPETDDILIARALIAASNKINALKEQVAALMPKATAYDAVVNKFDNISWRDVCNELKSTFGITEKDVRDKLIAERWIYRINTMSGKSKYKPYTETIFRDLMVVKDVLCNDGKVRQGNFFTYKGREQLIDWFAPVVAMDNPA